MLESRQHSRFVRSCPPRTSLIELHHAENDTNTEKLLAVLLMIARIYRYRYRAQELIYGGWPQRLPTRVAARIGKPPVASKER